MKLSPSLILPFFLCLQASALPKETRGEPNVEERDFIIDIGNLLLEDLSVGKVLDQIDDYIGLHPDVEINFPGLKSLLQKVNGNEIDTEDSNRQLLKSIQYHSAFRTAFDELDEDLQTKLSSFIDGDSASNITKRGFWVPPSPAAKRHFKRMETSGVTPISRKWLNSKRETSPVIYEDSAKTKVMTVNTLRKCISFWSEGFVGGPA